MIGKTILGYTVDEKIGSGAFGTVYKVSKSNVSGTYTRALKHITIPTKKQYIDVLNSMGGDHSKADNYFAEVLKRVTGEIQIISQLSETGCKNIVRYYENDIVETPPPKTYDIYILMEYLTPFDDFIFNNELKVSDVIKLGKDILAALVSCHSQNIIHRDIKDDNIFIGADNTYKLGDFGVSKLLNDRSRAESMKGTPNYIAPEVYLGKEKYDNTVDLYSLGIVLYRLLNKLRFPFLPDYPHSYDSDDEEQAFERRIKGEIPGLPINAENELGQVILKAISNRKDRFNSADEFLKALESAEHKLNENELDIVINTVVSSAADQDSIVEEKKQTQATFGSDMDTSEMNSTTDDSLPNNLFNTFGDSISEIPPESIFDKNEPFVHSDAKSPVIQSSDTTSPPKRKQIIEEPTVSAVDKKSLNWLLYLVPVLIAIVYVVTYLIIIPNSYEKAVSLIEWLFTNPMEIAESLKDPYTLLTPIYKVYALKIFNWLLVAGFITSLYFIGRTIHFKKPETNPNAILTGNMPYLRSIEILEEIKQIQNTHSKQVLPLVKRLNERLKNESSFGIGNNNTINCENEIASMLDVIESNISALQNEKTAAVASRNISACCKKIDTKLKLRIELKKK